jgi:hypothetical protein
LTDTEDIVITREDLRDALREKLGRIPTKAELKRFREFCVVDIGDWLGDNAKSFESND